MADLHARHHGSICVLYPRSDAGKVWMKEHLPQDAIGWGVDGIIVEPRYLGDILTGATNDGLEVE